MGRVQEKLKLLILVRFIYGSFYKYLMTGQIVYLKEERRVLRIENVPLLIINSPNIFGLGVGPCIDIRVIVKDNGDLEIEQSNSKVIQIPNKSEKEIFIEHYFRSPIPYHISNQEKVLTISF